jgi:16S rRNA processing protein RimM
MLRVGQVRGAFGVAGAVKVEPLTDHEDRLQAGAEVWLAGTPRRIEWARARPAGVVLKLTGVDDRTLAGLQAGRYLEVPLSEARPLPEGAWYHHQLLGLRVRSESGRQLGEIVDVLERPANDVWVARAGRSELLVPATKDAVLAVDLGRSEVVVADWLLQVEQA